MRITQYIATIITAFALYSPLSALAIPGDTNSATVAFAGRTADYGDWDWKVYEGNDCNFKITISDCGAASSYSWTFVFTSSTGAVLTVATASISTSTTNITFSVADTSLPSSGSYRTELQATETSSGDKATAGQGKILIKPSLF